MRMKHSRRTDLHFKNRTVTKDSEGVTTETWGNTFTLKGEMWNFTDSTVNAKSYGEKINTRMNVRIDGKYTRVNVLDELLYPSNSISPNNAQGAGNQVGVSTTAIQYKFGDNKIRENDAMCVANPYIPDFRIVQITAGKQLQLVVEKI